MLKEATKPCFKCGEIKVLSLFYRHPKMQDGRVNKCKECNKLDVAKNTRKNYDYYLNYDRVRSKTEKRRQSSIKFSAITRQRWKLRKKATTAVANAICSKKLIRPCICEYCGKNSNIEAHHSSYSEDMYLVVTWLCVVCHNLVHRKYDF
jgi:hypothetical protein